MNLFWKVTNKVYFWAAVYIAIQFPAIGIPILLIEIYRTKKIIKSLPGDITEEQIKNFYDTERHLKYLTTTEQIKKIREAM